MESRIKGFYSMWNKDSTKYTVAKVKEGFIAFEIAWYLYGKGAVIIPMYVNSANSVPEYVRRINDTKLENAYISEDGKVVVYKTRKEIINDILLDL